jgi:hypothetical protein
MNTKVGLTKFGNPEKSLKNSANILFWQFRADDQKYGHRPLTPIPVAERSKARGMDVCVEL